MLENKKNPKCRVFISWISKCGKIIDPKRALFDIEEMLHIIGEHNILISKKVVNKLKEFLNTLDIDIEISKINRRYVCHIYLIFNNIYKLKIYLL